MTRMDENKKLAEKDKHHISWKNHGIDDYIEESFQKYLEKKKKKQQEPEAADFQDSFDYDKGFNIEEVYEQ